MRKDRPTSVTVIAVIGLCLSGLGVLILGIRFMFWVGVFNLPQPDVPDLSVELMDNSTLYQGYFNTTEVIAWILFPFGVAASIGLLKLQPWARKFKIVLAWYSIPVNLVGTLIHIYIVTIPVYRQLGNGPDGIGNIIGLVLTMILLVLALGYALTVIILLSMRHVVEAFTPIDG